MRPDDKKMTGKSKLYWLLLLLGLMAMEFPGVLFFKDIAEPYIFGFPFIYGYNMILWFCMVVVILIAYLDNWGEPKDKAVEATPQGGDNQ